MKNTEHNSSWNTRKEKLLRFWQEECRIYSWIYTQTANRARAWRSALKSSAIIIAAVSSAISSIGASDDKCASQPQSILIITAIFTAILFVTNGLETVIKFEEIIASNISSSRQHAIIATDIDTVLTVERSERPNSLEFIKEIRNRKNKVLENAPAIHPRCWKDFNRRLESGEQIGFINHQSFKSYLEQTVNFNELDFHDPLSLAIDDSPTTKHPTANTNILTVGSPIEENRSNITTWNNIQTSGGNEREYIETDQTIDSAWKEDDTGSHLRGSLEKIHSISKEPEENELIHTANPENTYTPAEDTMSIITVDNHEASPVIDRRARPMHIQDTHQSRVLSANIDPYSIHALQVNNIAPSSRVNNIGLEDISRPYVTFRSQVRRSSQSGDEVRSVTPNDPLDDLIRGNTSTYHILNALESTRRNENRTVTTDNPTSNRRSLTGVITNSSTTALSSVVPHGGPTSTTSNDSPDRTRQQRRKNNALLRWHMARG